MSEDEDEDYEDDENSPEATMAGTVYINQDSKLSARVAKVVAIHNDLLTQ